MTPTVTEQLTNIEKHFEELNKEFGQTLERQREEIQEIGGTSTETRQKIESFEERMSSMGESVQELQEKLNAEGGLRGAPGSAGGQRTHRTSHGSEFLTSDQYKDARAQGAWRSNPAEVSSFFPTDRRWIVSDVGSGAGQAGGLLDPITLPGLQFDPQRTFVMRDLLNVVSVDRPQIEIMRVTGFYNFFANTVGSTASAQAVVTLDNAIGLFVGQTLSISGGGNTETKVITAINTTTNAVTVNSNFANTYAAGSSVYSSELGAVPHGAVKPRMNVTFSEDVVNCITLAHWVPIHRQTLDDIPVVQNVIDTELIYGLALAEEYQLLQGPGTGGNILGFMNNGAIQNQGTMAGAGIQQLDWIRKAMTKALVAEYPVNGIIVNPADWENIELLKDGQNRYLYIDVNPGREPRIWQVPVVVSNSMPAGKFLLGAFGLGATLYDREQSSIRFSDQHADYFVRNAVLFLAEERIGLGVQRPQAFVRGAFA